MKDKSFKEWSRKKLVYLKRTPQIFPIILLIVTCLIFNLNMTAFSDTTAIIYAKGMGLTMFVITLFSFLSIVSYVQAFKKRQKVRKIPVILTYAMMVLTGCADAYYYYCILYGIKLRVDPKPIEITANNMYILTAKSVIVVHFIFVIITIIVMALVPVIKKAFSKINTDKKIEEAEIEQIETSEE